MKCFVNVDLKVKEKDFQAQLMQVALMLGGMVYHTYDSRKSPKGYPDLVILTMDRRLIFAELKTGKLMPTEDQWAWLRWAARPSGVPVVARRLGGRRAHYPVWAQGG